MTSLPTKTALCAICGKAGGNFTCRGCAQDFCANHVVEHRQALGKKMDEVMLEHDQLRESLNKRAEELCPHLSVKQIDEWEEKSIEMIHQAAADSRSQLCDVAHRFKNKIIDILAPISQELRKFHEDDTFVETDLTEWITKLEKLKNELTMPSTVSMETDRYDTSFVNRLSVIETPDDIFQESVGNVRIEDDGKVITHGFWSSYGMVCSRGEYSTGCYRFHFKLENFDKESIHGFFFGIISKLTPLKTGVSVADTSYGWVMKLREFVGVKHGEYRNESNDENIAWNIRKNNIFELIINCDQRKIRLTNKQTNAVDEIIINIDKCPFPWRLNFSLYTSSECIRLLQCKELSRINE